MAYSLGDLASDAPDHAPRDTGNADSPPLGGGSFLRSGSTSGILSRVGAGSGAGTIASGGQVPVIVFRLEVDAWRYLDAVHCVADLRIADEDARHNVHHLEDPVERNTRGISIVVRVIQRNTKRTSQYVTSSWLFRNACIRSAVFLSI